MALVTLTLLGAGLWGVRVMRVLQSVDANAAYWAVPRGEDEGLVYVALGDSAAQGIGASRPEVGYVSLVAEQLRAASGLPVRVVNLSSSGARMRDVVDVQLPRLADMCADVVTVGVGGNDIRHYDRTVFARDVQDLIAGLPPGTFIADLPYFMHGQWQVDVEEGNVLLTETAEANGLVVAGLQEAMRERGWQGMFTDYAADWFHPDDDGHRIWASVFSDAIRPQATSVRPAC